MALRDSNMVIGLNGAVLSEAELIRISAFIAYAAQEDDRALFNEAVRNLAKLLRTGCVLNAVNPEPLRAKLDEGDQVQVRR